jgi:hypothetical protein
MGVPDGAGAGRAARVTDFLREETTTGKLLLAATVVALP